jgi:hypothetical protein
MLWHRLVTIGLQTTSFDSWYSGGAQTLTRWGEANDWLLAARPLRRKWAVGLPEIPQKNFMLDLEHCR